MPEIAYSQSWDGDWERLDAEAPDGRSAFMAIRAKWEEPVTPERLAWFKAFLAKVIEWDGGHV